MKRFLSALVEFETPEASVAQVIVTIGEELQFYVRFMFLYYRELLSYIL